MSLYDILKDAEHPVPSFGDAIQRLGRDKRILMTATLELSPICNFTCPFCYARVSPEQLRERGEQIMRFDEWKRYIDEFAAMNVDGIILTGGECMLHPDFERIYRYIYGKGMAVTVMTNSSCLTDSILQMLCECPPDGIYTTLYGGSPETYQTVCGNAAYFDRVLANIRRMAEAKLEVVLQITVSNDNIGDLEKVDRIAKELDIPLRISTNLIRSGRCTEELLEENSVNEDEVNEIADRMYGTDMFEKEPITIFPVPQPVIEKGMTCAGGRCSCAITYRGKMQTCVVFDALSVETKGRPLADCWRELVALCDEVPRLVECINCLHRPRCQSCMARHYNDTKEFGKPSPRLCFKCTHPERAKEIEERFAKNGYLMSDADDMQIRKK